MSNQRRALAPMAAWNVASFLAAAAYGFFVTRLVVRDAGDAAFGVWATVSAIRGFILFLDGGLAFAVNRDAALDAKRPGEGAARIRAAWRIYAAIAAISLVVFALAGGFPATLLGLSGTEADRSE